MRSLRNNIQDRLKVVSNTKVTKGYTMKDLFRLNGIFARDDLQEFLLFLKEKPIFKTFINVVTIFYFILKERKKHGSSCNKF